MKFIILTLCVAGAFARPDISHVVNNVVSDEQNAQILKQDLNLEPDGAYQWSIETDNGIAQQAQGSLADIGETPVVVVSGQAEHKTPEGETVQLSYIADQNGYQPQGSHLPTPPPIPEAILRSIEYIMAHPPKPEQS